MGKYNSTEMDKVMENSLANYTRIDLIDGEERIAHLVNSFISRHLWTRAKDKKTFIASLYAKKSDADPQIIKSLKELIIDLSEAFSPEDLDFLLSNFNRTIRHCQKQDIEDWEYRSGFLSEEYLQIIYGLITDPEDMTPEEVSILLPYGNIRLADICPYSSVDIIESSQEKRALSYIIKDALNIKGHLFSPEEYKASENCTERKLYNYIFSLPPCTSHDISSVVNNIEDCLQNKLIEGGSMAILFPREVCYSVEWEEFRRFFVNLSCEYRIGVTSVGIPSSTSLNNESLFLIEKTSTIEDSMHNSILFIDADKDEFMLYDKEVGPYAIKVDSILESIELGDPKSVCAMPIEKLDQGTNLLPARYFRWNAINIHPGNEHMATKLGDIIRIIPKVKAISAEGEKGFDKVISRQNLSGNYLACDIKFNDIKSSVHSDDVYSTKGNGGFAAFAHGKVYIGKIEGEPEDIAIYLDETITHFTVDTSRTSLDYILKVLSSEDYVAKQVHYLTKGYGWVDSYLHEDDLLDISIILPSLEQQNEILLADSRRGYKDKDAEIQRNFDEFRKNMHMQKHKIGQTISALYNWVNLINYARELGNGTVCDSTIVIPAYDTSVQEIFEKLTQTTEKLQKEILALDSSYGMEKDIEKIALADFIDDYLSKNIWTGFEILWDSRAHRHQKDIPVVEFDERNESELNRIVPGEFIVKAGEPLEYILGTYKGIETILDNIIANASAHGFKEQDKIYKVKLDIMTEDDQVILFVSNNGEPLHEKMKSSEVFTYGHTSGGENHSGIGCYQIKDYMDTFNGNVEVISTPNEEFTVTYKLSFTNANPPLRIL